MKYDRIIETSYGTYYIKGDDGLFIGHNEDGFWYWIFQLADEDMNQPDEWFEELDSNEEYYSSGYSVASFDTLEELYKDLQD